MRTLFWSLILGLLFIFPTISIAGNVKYIAITQEIAIDGDIDIGADLIFQDILAKFPVHGVILYDSVGGYYSPATAIGVMIKQHHMYTYALDFCDSACAYIWLAGSLRMYDTEEKTELIQHLPNYSGIVTPLTIGSVFYYMGQIGLPEDYAIAITEKSQYNSNVPFDFISFIKEMEPWGVIGINRQPLDINDSRKFQLYANSFRSSKYGHSEHSQVVQRRN